MLNFFLSKIFLTNKLNSFLQNKPTRLLDRVILVFALFLPEDRSEVLKTYRLLKNC